MPELRHTSRTIAISRVLNDEVRDERVVDVASHCFYTVTNSNFPAVQYKPYYSLTQIWQADIAEPENKMMDNQFTLVDLAREMFKNAEPLEGKPMDVMNKTFSRLFSRTPTRL